LVGQFLPAAQEGRGFLVILLPNLPNNPDFLARKKVSVPLSSCCAKTPDAIAIRTKNKPILYALAKNVSVIH
jgi:hypothetical protein